jgi:ABC-type glycerol-3-phosphate transport system substrate-binding protein
VRTIRSISRIVAVGVLASIASAGFGCGGARRAAEPGVEEIVVWETYNTEEHAVFDRLARDFERERLAATGKRVSVRLERVPYEGLLPKLKYAAITHTTPDVCRVDNAWVLTLAYGKAIVPIDTLPGFTMSIEEAEKQYVAAALATNVVEAPADDGTWQRHLFGLPDQTNCVALFYNKALFRESAARLREAGLDPERAPKTWDEFVRYAKVLTIPEKRQFGFGMFATLWWMMPFLNTYGAEFARRSPDGKLACGFSDPAAVEAFRFIVSLYRQHKVEAGAWQTGAINPEQGFINGKYAMILTGPWNLKRFEGIDFGVSVIPEGPKGTSSNVGGSNMVVFRSSEHAPLALEFLQWFTSRDTQLRWSRELGQIPVNRDAFEEVARAASGTHLGVFLEQLRTARPLTQVPKMDQIEDRVVNPAIELMLKSESSSPDAILADACARVDGEYLSIINQR